ncbi:MAG: hypothetical protein QOJ99_4024 [Bryobacterales bacterium]|jgi:hypothetical protein|nr:hypothetical protein [Bryobacterales bacterium]
MSVRAVLVWICLTAVQAGAAEYRAGVAVADSPRATALAIERGRGERVVIMGMDAVGLPHSLPDVVAARVMKRYGLERGALLLHFAGTAASRAADADTLVDLAGRALDAMEPASVLSEVLCGQVFLKPFCPSDRKMAPVHGRIHSALQIAELSSFSLGARRYQYPVQAISFGRSLTILALGSDVPAGYAEKLKREFAETNLIVLGNSNALMPWVDDTEDRIMSTIRAVMHRVR